MKYDYNCLLLFLYVFLFLFLFVFDISIVYIALLKHACVRWYKNESGCPPLQLPESLLFLGYKYLYTQNAYCYTTKGKYLNLYTGNRRWSYFKLVSKLIREDLVPIDFSTHDGKGTTEGFEGSVTHSHVGCIKGGVELLLCLDDRLHGIYSCCGWISNYTRSPLINVYIIIVLLWKAISYQRIVGAFQRCCWAVHCLLHSSGHSLAIYHQW